VSYFFSSLRQLHLNFLAASATGHEDCCRFLTCPPLQRLTIARVLLVATRCADDSVSDFATAAREEAERRVAEPETTTSRKRSWDMLDAAIRALEVEARDAKMRLDATAQLPRRTQRMLGFRHGGLLDLPPLRLARCAASPSCWICRLSVSSSSSAGNSFVCELYATYIFFSKSRLYKSNMLAKSL
jgi:hypothetical protein